jgi:hypothetical protein
MMQLKATCKACEGTGYNILNATLILFDVEEVTGVMI